MQVSEVDFIEMFALTVKRDLLRIYLAICAFFKLIIHQVNIIETYLESLLDDNKFLIYIKLPLSIK